ncbi:MAG: hypothetical protein ACO3NZ_11195 [Pirellulales bacterium]
MFAPRRSLSLSSFFRRLSRASAVIAIALAGACPMASAAGFTASEKVLPATTRGWISIADPAGFRESFRATSYGELLNDPVLEPFVTSFGNQLREGGRNRLGKLGLTLEDLEKIPGGEITLALVEPAPRAAATLVLVDTTGHAEETKALVKQIGERLEERGATKLAADAAAPEVVVFALPLDEDGPEPIRRAVAFAHLPECLIVGDHAGVVAETVASLAEGREDCLASVPAFEAIRARCSAEVPEEADPIRWFIDPINYAFASRETYPPREERKGPDYLDILAGQGFDAIQAVGGYVHFDDGVYEFRHHTMVYAPPLDGRESDSAERFNLAARMLRFPNAEAVEPPHWVPRDASSWVAVRWDMQNAFASAGTLVDEMVGEKGVFEDVIASLKEDPDGPQIDVELDLIQALGGGVVVVTHANVPVDVDSERLLIAIEADDPERVAATVAKSMSTDPDMQEVEFDGRVIWELIDRSTELPMLEIETPGLAPPVVDRDRRGPRNRQRLREREERLLPHSAVTVAEGFLMIASHRDFLEHVLTAAKEGEGLAGTEDYQRVTQEIQRVMPNPMALRSFGRVEETIRTAYETIRQGAMPKSKSMIGQAINLLLDDGEANTVREQKIDGSSLPDFEEIRKYLGTVGAGMTSIDDGWYITGLSLPRHSEESDTPADTETVESGAAPAEAGDAEETAVEEPEVADRAPLEAVEQL